MRIYNNNVSNDKSLSDRSETSEISGSSNKISSSSSSASSSVNFPANCRKSSPTLFSGKKVNISMNKFINSKGLSASKDKSYFSPFVSHNGNAFLRNSTNEYYELKPPQFVKKDLTTIRRRVSAICKIQEELREMKAREDELKQNWQKVRVLGTSQPNLSTLTDETDFTNKEEESKSNEQILFGRTNSNPNLIDSNDSEEDSMTEINCRVGGPRRRIPLIAVWEQKIQKS